MFRFETIVKIVILCGWLHCGCAFAESQTGFASENKISFLKMIYKAKCIDTKTASDDQCNQWYQEAMRGNDQDCEGLTKEYIKARGDFRGACGKVIKADGTKGENACALTFARCDACNGTPTETEKATYHCASSEGGTSEFLSQITSMLMGAGTNGSDISSAKKQLSNCPALAPLDLEDLRKQTDDQRKLVKQANKEVPEKMEKANKAIDKMNEKLEDLRKDNEKARQDYTKNMKENSKAGDAAQKAIQDQMFGIQSELNKAYSDLSNVQLSRSDAAVKMKQAKIQVQLNCHSTASSQVGNLQQQVIAGTKDAMGKPVNQTWLRGGFSTMMRNVGVTDRAQWQRVAQKYYDWCMQSQPTRDANDGADDAYQLVMKDANNKETAIRNNITQLQQKQQSLVNGQCINGVPTSEQCKAAQSTFNDAQQIGSDYQAQLQSANQRAQTLQNQGMNEYNQQFQNAQQQQMEAMSEKMRLSNLEELYNLRNKISGGRNMNSKDYDESHEKYGAAAGAAENMIRVCYKDKTCDGICTEALKFVQLVRNDSEYDPRMPNLGGGDSANINIKGSTSQGHGGNKLPGAATGQK